MAQKSKARRRQEGYLHKSPAVCIVIHDPTGNDMPNELAAEILNQVTEIAIREGYLINFTRT